MRFASRHASLLVATLLVLLAGCRPFAELGQSCVDAPCGAGLVCADGVCEIEEPPPPPPPPPPEPCTSDEACSLNGSADGRACVEGECVWIECFLDVQCGTRICDQGTCTEREVCLSDGDCKDGGVCIDGACRAPCTEDAQCTGFLGACREGRCEQGCFIDLLCFGDLCVDGICVPPECGTDEDCGANQACNGGRCESYLPCIIDDDCFDPDFFCNALGRCEERPACEIDADCAGTALCRGGVCRPTEACAVDGDCPDADDECVAGRCVGAPECRGEADCIGGDACVNGTCEGFDLEPSSAIVVETPHGRCRADGAGACRLVLFAGEATKLRLGAFDDEGVPVRAPLVYGTSDGAVATLAPFPDGPSVGALGAGTALLLVEDDASDASHAALTIDVIAAATVEALRVLVVDARTGAPLAGAEVTAGDELAFTDATGLATFAVAPPPDPSGVSGLVVRAADHAGVAVLEVPLAGDVRVVLAPLADEEGTTAFRGRAISSGDETGPVGTGVILASCARVAECGVERTFLPAYPGSLEVPLLGALPVPLPRAVTLEAQLPLVGGVQTIRAESFVFARPGHVLVGAFEARGETDELLGLVFGGADDRGFVLDLARRGERFDVRVAAAGDLAAQPLVADGADLDGDGDIVELVPDFASGPLVDVIPDALPRERLGLGIGAPPAGARGELLVVLGLDVAGAGFVPTGLGTVTGNGVQQVKLAPPASAAQSLARRVARVEALFDDGGESVAVARAAAFDATVTLDGPLARPDGAFLLPDVPLVGNVTLVLPESAGSTTWRVRFSTPNGPVDLVSAAGVDGAGRSLVVPHALALGGAAAVSGAAVYRLPGADAATATTTPFLPGAGPTAALEDGASAWAKTAGVP